MCNITISGNLGSGKSSVVKILSERLGYYIVSAGKIFREIAEKQGLTVLELNEKVGSNKNEIDDKIDSEVTRISKKSNTTIFDSRLAYNFVEGKAFKVFIYVDIMEAASRVLKDSTRTAEGYSSLDEAESQLAVRQIVEAERFEEMYGNSPLNLNNYNLVIDSTWSTPEDVANVIISYYREYMCKEWDKFKLLINSKNVFPTQGIKDFNPDTLDYYLNLSIVDLISCSCVPVTHRLNSWLLLDGHPMMVALIRRGVKFFEGDVTCHFTPRSMLHKADYYSYYEDLCNFRFKRIPLGKESSYKPLIKY